MRAAFVMGLLLTMPLLATAAPAPAVVEFRIPAAPPTPFEQARAAALGRDIARREGALLRGFLTRPEGSGPFPALVLMHPCHERAWYDPWVSRLVEWGYVTLQFTRCQGPGGEPVDTEYFTLDWKEGAFAAYGALYRLLEMPFVDEERTAIIGWSRVGMAALSVLNVAGVQQFFEHRFDAAVALYPYCAFARGPHVGPVLVLTGGRDDWTPTRRCVVNARASAEDDYPIRHVDYAGAWHGFDIEAFGPPRRHESFINPDGFKVPGGTLGYEPHAHAAAVDEVRRFLAEHLR